MIAGQRVIAEIMQGEVGMVAGAQGRQVAGPPRLGVALGDRAVGLFAHAASAKRSRYWGGMSW
ncbi:hypothetical protein D3C87_1833010 [compost metagenome]